MALYTAHVTRGGSWWAIEIAELDGVYTQARRLDQVESVARDAIAATLDVDPVSVAIDVSVSLDGDVEAHLARLRQLRDDVERLNREASETARATARQLHDAGMPLRDVGAVMGISYQRAHQLVRS